MHQSARNRFFESILTTSLAADQPEVDTFSFVHLGNVTGTKLTGNRTIEIKVPTADQTNDPALCKKCRKMMQEGYNGRYVLADLYDPEQKVLFTIEDGNASVFRGCISTSKN